jgi:hypothetical protein
MMGMTTRVKIMLVVIITAMALFAGPACPCSRTGKFLSLHYGSVKEKWMVEAAKRVDMMLFSANVQVTVRRIRRQLSSCRTLTRRVLLRKWEKSFCRRSRVRFSSTIDHVVTIGCRTNEPNAYQDFFHGMIDEVRVSSIARPAAEIQESTQSGFISVTPRGRFVATWGEVKRRTEL